MNNKLEDKIRKQLANHGLILRKGRGPIHANNLGEYMVVDLRDNSVIIGADYEYSLEEINALISEGRL